LKVWTSLCKLQRNYGISIFFRKYKECMVSKVVLEGHTFLWSFGRVWMLITFYLAKRSETWSISLYLVALSWDGVIFSGTIIKLVFHTYTQSLARYGKGELPEFPFILICFIQAEPFFPKARTQDDEAPFTQVCMYTGIH
jgi:hypothetical protein